MSRHACWLLVAVLAGGTASAEDLPRGRIIDVQCTDDASQHYALYVPSTFTPERRWPVIFAFDARARGRAGVEQYQAAAEQYGYIVAGSNNARNGPWAISTNAAKAMATDVGKRFPLDPKRIYTAGMSGGARVALLLALNSELITGLYGPEIAGVFASSAGFPDGPHDSVPFAVFGSAGTDDFNHREMYDLDQRLTTPHRVEVFEGGHTWLPIELATHGVEWMEIQAMKSGARPRDPKLVDRLFAARVAGAEAQKSELAKMRELGSIAADFQGLKDVAMFAERADQLARDRDVSQELAAERADVERERLLTLELEELLARMSRGDNFAKLTERVTGLFEQSKAAVDSPERRIARRVLTGFRASSGGVRNLAFRDLMDDTRSPGQPARQR